MGFKIRQNYQMSHVIIFRLSTLKGTAKAPTEDLLRLTTLYEVPKPLF